jgi:PhnB protein
MNLSFHLTFDGRCEAAFAFYVRCLGGTIVTTLRYGDSPMAAQTPQDWQDKIVHATINIYGNALAGADAFPEDYAPPRGFFVLLDIDDPSDADRIFQPLSENGTVQMPIQETFWATRFGVLVDRFGVPWEINCGRRVSTS